MTVLGEDFDHCPSTFLKKNSDEKITLDNDMPFGVGEFLCPEKRHN